MGTPTLQVHVVWHPNFAEGRVWGEFLFNHLNRDLCRPAGRGLGIPVYFCQLGEQGELPPAVHFEGSARVAVLVLADDEMLLARQVWDPWHASLVATVDEAPDQRMVVPVYFTKHISHFEETFKAYQGIRLFDLPEPKAQQRRLLRDLYHAVSRLLRGTTKPIQLFLSHAKKDGLQIAEKLKVWIEDNSDVQAWFDVHRIGAGYRFDQQILDALPESALVAIQTDAYSSREWCRIECMSAKEFACPLLVVDALKQADKRVFPYLGNVPAIRWSDNAALPETIVLAVMREVVHDQYQRLRLVEQVGTHPNTYCYQRQPELLTLLNFEKKHGATFAGSTLYYPDPPLAPAELRLLQGHWPQLTLTTPTLGRVRDRFLSGREIVLSISISEDLKGLGLSHHHLADGMVEVMRYLLCQGAVVAYSGALVAQSFLEVALDVVESYREEVGGLFEGQKAAQVVKALHHRPCWPFSLMPTDWRLAHISFLDQTIGPLPEEDARFEGFDPAVNPTDRATEFDVKYAITRSLTLVRQQTAKVCDARVVLGGKVGGIPTAYQGRMPGVIEEAWLALQEGQPTFVIGGFGGAAAVVARALCGEDPPALTRAFQEKTPGYGPFLDAYNQRAPEELKLDYAQVLAFFHEKGIAGLNNGLGEADNRRLFEAFDPLEVAGLVLKGLASLLRGNHDQKG